MHQIVIGFDVDGTLMSTHGIVNQDMVALMRLLKTTLQNVRIIVWSGGGKDYAQRIADLPILSGLVDAVYSKLDCPEKVDIAFDDIPDFNLASSNLILKNEYDR